MKTLQQRLAEGGRDAFAELFDACANRVGHYLLLRLGNAQDAEDALQETFLRLTKSRRKLAAIDNLDAFVFTIARNEGLRLASRRAKRRRTSETLSGRELFDTAKGGAEVCETADTAAAAMASLDDQSREVVELKIYAGLTFDQIAQVTGVPLGTAATRYRSAIEKMRQWLTR